MFNQKINRKYHVSMGENKLGIYKTQTIALKSLTLIKTFYELAEKNPDYERITLVMPLSDWNGVLELSSSINN